MRKLKLEELNRHDIESFKEKSKNPLVIVLDSIRSAMNVGSFFRTADAFALEKIVLCGISALPPNREITKTAIGATESVDWVYQENIETAINNLKSQEYTIVGIEQTNQSILLEDFVPEHQKYALIFGNEVDGISDEILGYLDVCIEIPQFGTKHSLNVSVCGGVVIWDFLNKMNLIKVKD